MSLGFVDGTADVVSLGPVMADGNGRAIAELFYSRIGMNSLLICKDLSDTCRLMIR